jgi:hypothetical protein
MWTKHRWILVIVTCLAVAGGALLAVRVLPVVVGYLSYLRCLPPGIDLTTVQQELTEVGGHCDARALMVDAHGTQIRFYDMNAVGLCGGNPPGNDVLQMRSDELAKLKAHYTVIEIGCISRGIPVP